MYVVYTFNLLQGWGNPSYHSPKQPLQYKSLSIWAYKVAIDNAQCSFFGYSSECSHRHYMTLEVLGKSNWWAPVEIPLSVKVLGILELIYICLSESWVTQTTSFTLLLLSMLPELESTGVQLHKGCLFLGPQDPSYPVKGTIVLIKTSAGLCVLFLILQSFLCLVRFCYNACKVLRAVLVHDIHSLIPDTRAGGSGKTLLSKVPRPTQCFRVHSLLLLQSHGLFMKALYK